jgi:anti-anti-sigma regulatory factor
MPTEITQIDAADSDLAILRVSGELMKEDAVVLERIAASICEESGRTIVIDLSGLDFIDSEAAPSLRRLDTREGVSIEGLDILLQSSIDHAERQAN